MMFEWPKFLKYTLHVALLPLFLVILAVSWLPLVLIGLIRRLRKRPPRVLFGPTPSINFVAYARASRLVGIPASFCIYAPDGVLNAQECDMVLNNWRCGALGRVILPYAAFIYFLYTYDLFFRFFNVDGWLAPTPWRYAELPTLKAFGKRIVCQPYGADVQRGNSVPEAVRSFYSDPDRELLVAKNVAHSVRWSDFKISGGDLFVYAPYDFCHPCFAVDTTGLVPRYPSPDNSHTLRIVHGTNHPQLKGTQAIASACEKLKSKGYNVEFVFVSGMPNEAAREIYRSADIIVDQLFLGAYGLFSLEAMALGKPVVCYISPEVRAANACYAEAPIVSANAETVFDELVKLVENPLLRQKIGVRSRQYVERFHSVPALSGIFDSIFRSVWLRAPFVPPPLKD